MKNLTENQIKSKLEDNNEFDALLAEIVGVEDYYTEEYNNAVADGIDFDLLYDFDTNEFSFCNLGQGKTFEQFNNCAFIARCENTRFVEELEAAVNHFLICNIE